MGSVDGFVPVLGGHGSGRAVDDGFGRKRGNIVVGGAMVSILPAVAARGMGRVAGRQARNQNQDRWLVKIVVGVQRC